MQGLNKFLVLFKYEIKSFVAYLKEKKSRIAGFIFGSILIILYIISLLFIINVPILREDLIQYKDTILSSLPTVIFFLCLFAISNGFSIVTSVRKNQRRRIELLLQTPLKSKNVFRFFLLVNSLTVVSFYIIIVCIPLIIILMALEMNPVQLLIFSISFLLYLLAFAAIGCMLGVFYVKVPRRKRLILSVIFAIVFAIMYSRIYIMGPEEAEVFIRILRTINAVLGSSLSPFKWPSSLFMGFSTMTLMETILSYIFPLLLIELTATYLTRKYMSGAIKAPSEVIIIKHKYKRGLIYKLFGSQVGGIFRKELKVFLRSPAMISGFLFGYVLLVVMLLSFPFRINEPGTTRFLVPTLMIMFTIILGIIPAISIIPTSLALERKNLAIFLSSPISPSKLIRGKTLISDILTAIVIASLIPIMLVYRIALIDILLILFMILNIILFLTAASTYVAVRYTDFKAENPRKALKFPGVIIMLILILVSYMILPAALVAVIMCNLQFYVMLFLVVLLIPVYQVRRYLFNAAGEYLLKLEITEYA